MLQEGEERDTITGLRSKTHFGRPEWPKVFDSIAFAHPKLVHEWALFSNVSLFLFSKTQIDTQYACLFTVGGIQVDVMVTESVPVLSKARL